MIYINYDKYKEIGGVLDETAFKKHLIRACSVITRETHNRISKMKKIPDEVIYACKDMIEYMNINIRQNNIASENQSQGGTSEEITYKILDSTEICKGIDLIVYEYLNSVEDDTGTPLLYRGCCDVK